jgi:hypothetical protein
MARWKLAENAPVHYVQGAGLVTGGQEFEFDGQPSSSHWLRPEGGEWVPVERAPKPDMPAGATKPTGAAAAAPEAPAAPVESEPEAGEF